MPDLILASVDYSGYISPVKIVIFLILFFLWLLLVGWVYRDARAIGTNESLWTTIVFTTGAAAVIIWMVVPLFIIGLLFYLIAVGATSASYVMHRNTRVPDFDRVLTAEHIKGLFTNETKNLGSLQDLNFITANNNEVPIPEPKTPDFFGYKTAHDIFTDAMWRRASDVIFLPTHQNYSVIYYVDGAAIKQPSITREQTEYLTHFLKNLADLDVSEKRKPQKGKFRIIKDNKGIEWEIASAGSTAGEQIKLKQITQQGVVKLSDIGLVPDMYEKLNKIREEKHGLFIAAGPAKSGVTTTFYALLRNHDPFIFSISTVEKKPTTKLTNITQNVFTLSDTSTTTFAKKLQAVVRMGPDVVGVADCTDAETAQIACEAAKSGKIVYVSLEADNVIQALGKWIKLVGNKNTATETLLGISNQRLLRKLCNECKQAYEPKQELLKKFNIPAEKAKVFYRAGKVQYDKHGKPTTCENCQGTGYFDRMCVFEVITITDELRQAINQSKSLTEISTQFRLAKMLYLQDQVLAKVIDGTTAINEMVRIFSTEKQEKTEKPEQKT